MSSGVDVLVGRLGRMHGHHGPQRVWLPCLSPTLVTVCDEPIAEVARASSVALSWLTSYAVRVNCPDTARGVRTVRLGPPTRTIRTRSGRPVHAPFAHRVRTSCSAPCSRGASGVGTACLGANHLQTNHAELGGTGRSSAARSPNGTARDGSRRNRRHEPTGLITQRSLAQTSPRNECRTIGFDRSEGRSLENQTWVKHREAWT
jgi:hypothetical protein